MLLNSFFHIVNEENPNTVVETCHGASIKYIIRLNPEHPIFKGHFPGSPITPGVCVVQIAIDLFSHLFKQKYYLHKAKNIKFLNLIKPNEIDTICYQLSWEKLENDEYRLKALVTHDDIIYAKIDVTIKTES
jgi:3-hydroxyacyl-[acyl-carrier-protein] dehydratase